MRKTAIILVSFLMLFHLSAFGQIIELNNKNADRCRQQLLSAKDRYPVIFFYMHNCPYANKLRSLYEEVADETPDRSFFAFNFRDLDNQGNSYLDVAHDCLGKLPFMSPFLSIFWIYKNDVVPTIVGEYKSSGPLTTKQGILNFIKMDYHSPITQL